MYFIAPLTAKQVTLELKKLKNTSANNNKEEDENEKVAENENKTADSNDAEDSNNDDEDDDGKQYLMFVARLTFFRR